jgi:hypothetical protein
LIVTSNNFANFQNLMTKPDLTSNHLFHPLTLPLSVKLYLWL